MFSWEFESKMTNYFVANKIKELEAIVNKYKFIAIASKLTKSQQRALEKAEKELKEYEKIS